MSDRLLGREDAPIGARLWELLDETMLAVARSELSGRKVLDIDGPYGLGMKSVALPDEEVEDGLFVGGALPLAYVRRPFNLLARDVAAFEREPSSLDLAPLVAAALAVARKEDELVFTGTAQTPGLTSLDGAARVKLSSWDQVGAAQSDFIAAVSALDQAGFHGPYAVALAPRRYNLLLRRFETAAVSELEVVRAIAGEGVFKAPALKEGGVILQAGKEYAHLVLGQDMSVGFQGPADGRLEFFVGESVALRVLAPQSVCSLTAGK